MVVSHNLDPEPSDPATNNKRNNLGNSSKALAQYDNLVYDDDPNKPLTELVDVRSIRSAPPPDNPDQPFEPADVVDASYLDTWWVGVVMKFEDDKYTTMAEAIFSPGTAVEVNLNQKNILCAWFPTIYLAELEVINSFLLQFKSSNNCDVKVVVNGHQPPESGKIYLNLMEMVDAFYDMGW